MQKNASDMDKIKRRLFLNVADWRTLKLLQAISCSRTFGLGSPRQTHGKTTALCTNHTIVGPQHGLFMATHSLNGNHPVQVLYYGSMENVSASDPHAF